MKLILRSEEAHKVRRGLFNIDINLPGSKMGNPSDPSGLAQLGRFDHGHLLPGVFVGMHPHQNDEILTYIKEGTMFHEDTAGEKETINNTHIMLMNAGSGIYHQESIPKEGERLKVIQIFLRPEKDNEAPMVQFSNFSHPHSEDKWRLIAGHAQMNPPLVLRTKAAVYDTRLQGDSKRDLPADIDKIYLVHVVSGNIFIGNDELKEGDSMIYKKEIISVEAQLTSDLILFELDEKASYSLNGMYSGIR